MTSQNKTTVAGKNRNCRGGWLALFIGCTTLAAVSSGAPLRAADDAGIIIDPRIRGADLPETFVPDEFIVVLSADARRNAVAGVDRSNRPTINLPSLQTLVNQHGVVRFARQFPTAKPQDRESPFPDLTGHYKARFAPGADLDVVMTAFARDPAVKHVEKIGVHYVFVDPNDPYYQDPPPSFPRDQWHYWDTFGIDANLAWEIESGNSGVVVAVPDTGVRYFHTDLGGDNAPWGPDNTRTNGNIFVNAAEIPGNGADDDGNGRIDDTVGYDFVASTTDFFCTCMDQDCGTADNDPDDGDGHGTHVSGTVAAITNNARAVAGVAGGFSDGTTSGVGNGVKILPLRIGWRASCFLTITGVVRMDYAAEAFHYVADLVDAGVNVAAINCSWGSSDSGGISAATDAVLARDVMVIVAAGNSNSTSPSFLSTKAGTMSVAATTRSGTGASFTNHGDWVALAAPGEDILSIYRNPDDPDPNNNWIAVLSGTSMAAPHAAGVAALLESCKSGLSGPDKFNIMVSTTTPYSDSRDLGSGILNAHNALLAAGCIDEPQCVADADCDDGDPCTTDVCPDGVCFNTPIDCDDGNACTTDLCTDGFCQNDPISCDDGDLCTTDSCDPQTGCANTPTDCDDADSCTTDGCDPDTGACINTPIECDDGNECTSDACVDGACEHTPLPDDSPCSGGVCCNGSCTSPDCDTDAQCDDGDACTIDACFNAGTCSAFCVNDAIVCPPGETCVNGVCEAEVCNNNGVCEPGEDCLNCSDDCFTGVSGCGNGVCEPGLGEDCLTCPSDCNGRQMGNPNQRFCCGDGGGQNPVGCEDDRCHIGDFTCSDAPVAASCCGDGACEGMEDSCNCEVDCGPPVGDECDQVDDPVPDCAAKNEPCATDADCCSAACKRNGTCH